MEKKNILIIIVFVFVAISFGSYLAFNQILGDTRVTNSTRKVEIENYANQVRVDNVRFTVSTVTTSLSENIVELKIENDEYFFKTFEKTSESSDYGEAGLTKSQKESAPATQWSHLEVPKEAYETAKNTPGTVLVMKEETLKTKAPPYWLYSISIAVVISTILGAGLLTKQELRGNATSKLLDEGLESLTVRDVEIFSQIIRMEEFTIPELMRKTETSKVTTWRTVKKLVEADLVEETDEKKPPSRGLGGRGKPSKIYRFVG